MKRLFPRLVIVLLLSVGLFSALNYAAHADHHLQLVVFVPSAAPEFRAHGHPTIGLLGLSLYLLLFALHALTVRWVMMLWQGHADVRGSWLWLATPVFALDIAYVAVVHPYFLVTLLPGPAWAAYSGLVERCVPPLADVYSRWASIRYLPHITVLHGLLACLVSVLCLRQHARKVSYRLRSQV